MKLLPPFLSSLFLLVMISGSQAQEFSGTWTSYKTKTVKKCSWGDYRIPDSDALDVGAGEFVADEKYLKNGWESYMAAYFNSTDSPEAKVALKKEEEQWWKE